MIGLKYNKKKIKKNKQTNIVYIICAYSLTLFFEKYIKMIFNKILNIPCPNNGFNKFLPITTSAE